MGVVNQKSLDKLCARLTLEKKVEHEPIGTCSAAERIVRVGADVTFQSSTCRHLFRGIRLIPGRKSLTRGLKVVGLSVFELDSRLEDWLPKGTLVFIKCRPHGKPHGG
jgi:hypothetical protein